MGAKLDAAEYERAQSARSERAYREIVEASRGLVVEVERAMADVRCGVACALAAPLLRDRLFDYREAVARAGQIRTAPLP